MAQENINIDLIIQTAESAKNLGDLKRSMGEVRKALDQVEVGSTAFKRLNESLDDGAQKLRSFRRGFDSLQAFSAFGNTIASSFGLASGVISQFAGDNENLSKQLLKVQSALTIVQSFSGLAEAIKAATIANEALNASLLTNPYVLVAAGIAAAVAALIDWGDTAEDAKKKTDEFNKTLSDNTQFILGSYDKIIQKLEEEKAALNDNAAIRLKDIQINEARLKGLKEALTQLQLTNATSAQGNQFDQKFLEEKKKLIDEIGKLENKLAIQKIDNEKQTKNEIIAQNKELARQQELLKQNVAALELQNIQEYTDAIDQLIITQQFEVDLLKAQGATDDEIKQKQIDNLSKLQLEYAKLIPIIRSSNIPLSEQDKLIKSIDAALLKTDRQLVLLQTNTKKANTEIIRTGSIIRNELEGTFDAAIKLDKAIKSGVFAPFQKDADNLTKYGSAYLDLVKSFDEVRAATNIDFLIAGQRTIEQGYGKASKTEEIIYNTLDLFKLYADRAKNLTSDFINSTTDINIQSLKTVDETGKQSLINTKDYSSNLEQIISYVKEQYTKLSDENENLFQNGKITFDAYLTEQEKIYQDTIGLIDQSSTQFSEAITNNISEVSKATGVSEEELKKLAEVLGTVIPNEAKKSVNALNQTRTSINQLPNSIINATKEVQKGLQVASQFVNDLGNIFAQYASNRLTALEAEQTRVTENLQNQYEAGLISQEQYNAKSLALNKEYNEKVRQEKKRAWRNQKAADVVTATIGVANAVINGLQTQPFVPLGLASAALAGALGAVQIGLIMSQPEPEFAQGGYVSGPGGPKDDMINAKLSNGEYVVNAKSTSAFFPLIDAINQLGNVNFSGLMAPQLSQPQSVQTVKSPIPQKQDVRVNLVWQDVANTNKTANNIKARTTF